MSPQDRGGFIRYAEMEPRGTGEGVISSHDWRIHLPGLFKATEEELAQAKRRVEEADQILGEARAELTQIIIARGYLFPELHDESGLR